MSEGGRLFHPVTGSLAAIFLLLLAAGLVSHAARYHDQGGHQSGYSETSPASGPVVPKIVSEAASADGRQQIHDEADLAAQQRMANSAENSFYVGLLSLALLSATVVFAGLAWKAAANGAEAAWKTEDTARDIGHKQAQAYVHSISASYQPESKNALSLNARLSGFKIVVRNIGQTAAKKVEAGISWDFIDSQMMLQGPNFEVAQPRTPASNIAPGQEIEISVTSAAAIAYEQACESPDFRTVMRIWGTIRYETVFNRHLRSQFAFYIFCFPIVGTDPVAMFSPPAIRLDVFESEEKNG